MPNKKSLKQKSSESLTLSTLAERVNNKIDDIDENKIKQVTNAFFDVIKREILDTGSFKLLGFGTFDRMLVEESTRKNPRTGEEITTAEHYKIKFVPASGLAKRINKPYEHLKPEIIEEAAVAEDADFDDDLESDVPVEESVAASQELSAHFGDELSDSARLPDEFSPDSYAKETYTQSHELTRKEHEFAPHGALSLEDASVVKSSVTELDAIFSDEAETTFPIQSDAGVDCSKARMEHEETCSEQFMERDELAALHQEHVSSYGKNLIARGEQTVANQTVQHAVIEHQVIQQQVVQQQVIQQQRVRNEHDDDIYDPDYDDDDYDEDIQKYINRCWFFTGVAVVLTVFMLGALVYVFVHRVPPQQPRVQHVPQEVVLTDSMPYAFRIATDDNVYASLAYQQYGERNLWPYIFSANMLRFSDPDKPGGVSQLTIPSKPDKAIDRRDIELSVIDVYDSYRSLIMQRPNGRAAQVRKEHAVIALLCGESLYSGFIDKYAVRFETEDVQAARETIERAYMQ